MVRAVHPFAPAAVVALLALPACMPSLDPFSQPSGDPGDPVVDPPLPPAPGVIDAPRFATIVDEPTATAVIHASGYHTTPGEAIDMQLLADPADLSSWTTVATAVADTAASPGVLGEHGEPMYAWRVDVAPNAGQPTDARWPAGGLVRLRALDHDGAPLRGFDHDVQSCFDASPGQTLGQLARTCGSRFAYLVLVSPSPNRADQPPGPNLDGPRYLSHKPILTVAETQAYYAATAAPATLTEFLAKYGLDAPGLPMEARYYNAGDLGIGRHMKCAKFPTAAGEGFACAVENYGLFGGLESDAISQLVSPAATPLATVAMVYTPPATAPNAVTFVAYSGGGARLDQAQLDTQGDNMSIPGNCLNCHGSSASYDPATHAVTGARFLPFDPAAFDYANVAGATRHEQEEAFRRMNEMVGAGEPALGDGELVDGLYNGQVDTVGNTADTRFVPAGWSHDGTQAKVYREVVAPYCRSCHASQGPGHVVLDFTDATEMKGMAAQVAKSVCNRNDLAMPNAEQTLRRFWQGRARAYLVAFLDVPGACAP
jgi:hypothetical protein